MSFIEDDESKWSAADHAELVLRPLMERVKALRVTAQSDDDAEAMNAVARCYADFLTSVLWQRRNQPEHGGRMRSAPDEAAVAERNGILAEMLKLLAEAELTPAGFALAVSIIGALKFAEHDGKMQPQADFDTLLDVHRAWVGIDRVTAEGSGPGILRYLANTAVSVIYLEDPAAVAQAAAIIQAMVREISIPADQINEYTAGILTDLCGALLYYQGENPHGAYPDVSSWEFLQSAPWRNLAIEKINWPRMAQLASWAVGMLRKHNGAESTIAWSWLIKKLDERPLPAIEDIDWRGVGHAFVQALLDENFEAAKAQALLGELQSLAEDGGPSAIEALGAGLATIAASVPRARNLNPHDVRFVLSAVESGIAAPGQADAQVYVLTSLLVHHAFHDNWDLVDQSLARFADANSTLGWAGSAVAYRTMSELVLMPEVGSRIGAIVQHVSTPYAGTEGTSAVEAARRAAIDSLLSRPELEVHPRIFFPLLGISSDG